MYETPHGGTRGILIGLVIGIVCAGAADAHAQGTLAGRYAAHLVDQPTYEYIHGDLLYTHYGDDRRWGPEHDLARANIETLMAGYGLITTQHWFTYHSDPYYNVVGELVGTSRADEIIIVGAHFDSTSYSGPAPGADDNASGVAAFLTVAHLVCKWTPAATIRFIAFDREEQGLYGSFAYANDHSGDNIVAVVICDMIAHNATPNPIARVWGRSASTPLKNDIVKAVIDYTSLTAIDSGRKDSSDHVPFEQLGFQAALLQEADIPGNPYYHTQWDSVDTPGYIDYDYAIEITRGLMGWLVDAAGVTPEYVVGDVNCDLVLDFGDINPFVLALSNRPVYEQQFPYCPHMNADCNGDERVDFGDINPFIALLTRP